MNKSGKFIFLFIAVLIGSILLVLYCVFFEEILKSDNFVISLWQNKQIDIGNFNSKLWLSIKISSIILFFISYFIIFKSLFYNIFIMLFAQNQKCAINSFAQNFEFDSQSLKIDIGQNLDNKKIVISELGLYQNILITGTIGTRKD